MQQRGKILIYLKDAQLSIFCVVYVETAGQKKRFKDTLKASLKDFAIDHNSWETTVQNRAAWRGVINKGAAAYDSRRLDAAKSKRATRKSRASSAPETHDPTALPCPHCPRTFKAKIGLISHLRTHPTPLI